MNAHEIKATVASYFRYQKQCPIICFEASERLRWASGGLSDILVITPSRMLYDIEVKCTLADLKNDIKKRKHWIYNNAPDKQMVHKFYFAIPSTLRAKTREICDQLYPYAGILCIDGLSYQSIIASKEAKQLSQKRIPSKEIFYLVKEQSGTLCRLANDKVELRRISDKTRGQVAELHKLLKIAGITY